MIVKLGLVRLSRIRAFSTRTISVSAVCLLLALLAGAATTGLTPARLATVFHAAPAKSTPWRESGGRTVVAVDAGLNGSMALAEGVEIVTSYEGDETFASALKAGGPGARAGATGDFDRDGVADLVVAYQGATGGAIALYRGNVDAIYPNAPEAQARRAAGTFSDAPFLETARVVPTPVAGDYAGAGDFDADGKPDVVVASRGGDALWVLAGDGAGGFAEPRRIALPGPLTALATGEVNRSNGLADVVAAVGGPSPHLLVFESRRGAFAAEPETVTVPAVVTDLALGRIGSGKYSDAVAVAGGELLLVHGRDRAPRRDKTKTAAIETRALPSPAVSVAIGDFAGDGVARIAVLVASGEVRAIAAPKGETKRLKAWKTEQVATGLGAVAKLATANVSGRAGEELLVVDAAAARVSVVEGNAKARAEAISPAVLAVTGTPAAVLGMRLDRDGRDDLVVLRSDATAPVVVETASKGGSFVVTNTDSFGPGSLDDAILQANSFGNGAIVTFNIPGTPPFVIEPGGPFPGIGSAITIDATTQPGYAGTPIVRIDGSTTDGDFAGLVVQMPASGAVIRGLSITNWGFDGIRTLSETSNTTIEGCYIGLTPDGSPAGNGRTDGSGVDVASSGNTIGGTTAAARNVISANGAQGVRLSSSVVDNVVSGNYIGTTTDGNSSLSNTFNGVELVNASFTVVGGSTAGARNVISGNDASAELSNGVYIHGEAFGNDIQGNIIGLAANGSSYLGNGANGVLDQGVTTLVGGTAPGEGNIISGNLGDGVLCSGADSGDIFGNVIGVDETVSFDRRNSGSGVRLFSSFFIFVGDVGGGNVISRNLVAGITLGPEAGFTLVSSNYIGTDPTRTAVIGNFADGIVAPNAFDTTVENNVITNNAGNGITYTDGTSAFVGNSIYGNNGLGIDLGGDGVTANDPLDEDVGPNDLLNFPVITAATTGGGMTFVDGSYDGPPFTDLQIEFFVSPSCDGTNGEGAVPAGTTFVSTDDAGHAEFTGVALSAPASVGNVVTATASALQFGKGAKGAKGNVDGFPYITSEFSACTTVAGAGADIAATNIASVSTARRGDVFTYTVTVTNNGPGDATIPFFSNSLPSNVTFVSLAAEPGWTASTPSVGSSGTVSAFTPSLASGASAVFTIAVQVAESAAGFEVLESYVNAAASEEDPDPSNNSAILAAVTVESEVDLAVSQMVSPDPVQAGSNLTYTITVDNLGPDFFTGITLTGATPDGTTFVSISAPPGWNVTNAPMPGASGAFQLDLFTFKDAPRRPSKAEVITFVVATDPMLAPGTLIQNSVSVSSPDFDPDTSNNTSVATATVADMADLAVTKSYAAPVLVNQDVTYTVTVTNNGPSAAADVMLDEMVPTGMTYRSVSAPPGWNVTEPPVGGTGTLTATIPTLGSGVSAVFTIVMRVDPDILSSTVIFNTVTVASSTADPNLENNTATEGAIVDKTVDVAISQIDAPDPVLAGDDITYTISFSNNGPDFPSFPAINGTIPANTTFQSLSVPPGWSAMTPPVGGTGGYSISIGGQPKRRGIADFVLVVRVNPGTPPGTVISHTVAVSNPDFDPDTSNNTSVATTTVADMADLAVTKGHAGPVRVNGDVTYTVTVANAGPSAAANVVLTEMVPAGMTYRSVSAPPGWNVTEPPVGGTGTLTATRPTLGGSGVGEVFFIVMRVDADVAPGTTIMNTATATSSTADPDLSNNSATDGATVEETVDVAVSQTDAPDPVLAGGDITYTITLSNNGPHTPSAPEISGTIPANTTFQSLSLPPGWLSKTPPVGGTGSYSIFGPGSPRDRGVSADFVLVVRVDPGTPGGTAISHTVAVSNPDFDPNTSNNSATEMTAVAGQADLAVAMTGAPNPVLAGANVTYTVMVTNNGPDPALGVALSEGGQGTEATFVSISAPPGWSVSTPPVGSAGTITATTASLAPGASAVFTIVKQVPADTPGFTSLANAATVSSATVDSDSSNNMANEFLFVAPQDDVFVTMTDTPDPVDSGDEITYTITVGENGPDPVGALSLEGETPANTTFVSFAGPPGWNLSFPPVGGTGSYSASIEFGKPTRRGGDVFTLVVQVNPATPAGTVITNTVTASSPEADPVPANNTAVATTTVSEDAADLAVTKIVSAETVFPGGELTYTVTVTNNGPDPATSVVLEEEVPAFTSFVSLAAPGSWSCETPPVGDSGAVVCTTSSLASGASATFTLVVRVDALVGTGTAITNTATASSATLDPNLANNSATTSSFVSAPPSSDVALTKTGSPAEATPGSTVTYSLVATNNGPNEAFDLTITDPLPAGINFVSVASSAGSSTTAPASGASGTVRCSWPGITAVGESRTMTIVASVAPSAAAGTAITNTATATSASLDTQFDNNSASATTLVVSGDTVASSDISISLNAIPQTVDTGTFVTYTMTISNGGPDEAENVHVSGSTPLGTRLVSISATDGTITAPPVGGTGDFTCTFATIPAGESRVVTLVLNVIAEGGENVGVQFVVSSDTDDPTPQNNTVSATTTVVAGLDVLLTWDPPLATSDDALNPPLHLQSTPVTSDSVVARGDRGAKRNDVIGYNVYRSNQPEVSTDPQNLFTSLPPSQTSVVVPTAPDGSFFTITAVYPNGESGGSNEASGALPQPVIMSVRIKANKIVVFGENFTDKVQVFVDGIPFVKNAKVKNAKGKINQKGNLLIGTPVRDYIVRQGGVILVSVLNEDEGIGTFLYRP